MLMSREAAKHFIERKSGNIINIGSTAGVRGAANGTSYYASKFAVRGMTECWRGELRQHNVRVIPDQSERGAHQLCGHCRVLAGRQQSDEAAVGRHRARGEGGARDERSRLHDRADGLRDQSERLSRWLSTCRSTKRTCAKCLRSRGGRARTGIVRSARCWSPATARSWPWRRTARSPMSRFSRTPR